MVPFNETLSDTAQDLVSNQPGFVVRHGASILLSIVILVLLLCWFIPYPDLVPAMAKLSSSNPPRAVLTRVDGKLIKVLIQEEQYVEKDQLLGYMESTADANQVIQLTTCLDSITRYLDANDAEKLLELRQMKFAQLGELQTHYQSFTQAFINFKNYLSAGYYIQRQRLLINDLENLKRMELHLNEQKELHEKDLQLAVETYEMNDTMKAAQLISIMEYRSDKSKLLSKQQSIPQIKASIIDNSNRQNEKLKELYELGNTIKQQQIVFWQATNTLQSEIDKWSKLYLLKAPVAGQVSFASFIEPNMSMGLNQPICYITPSNKECYAQVFIPQSNFGKIKLGQTVLLKLAAYPSEEFGILTGSIDFISRIPSDSGYMAKVTLPDGLVTSYHQQIVYQDGLLAQAQIVTENVRLLQRFYYDIYKQLQR